MVKVREERGFGFYEWKEKRYWILDIGKLVSAEITLIKTLIKRRRSYIGYWISKSVIPAKAGIQEKALRVLSFQRRLKDARCSFMAFLGHNTWGVSTWIPDKFLRCRSEIFRNDKRGLTTPNPSLLRRGMAAISVLALLVQVAGLGVLAPVSSADADTSAPTDGICGAVSADVVLAMDVSGSMENGAELSKCEWWNRELIESSYQWVLKTNYDVTEEWCEEKSRPPYRTSTYTPATNSKIVDAKNAANSFLGNLGVSDQSGLVSFAAIASVEQSLTNIHSDTQSAVGALNITSGGATNIGGAIGFANGELTGWGNSQAVKVIILLTDGNDSSDIDDKIKYAKSEGYKIFTIGLGSGVNSTMRTMLENIANTTGGKYYYAEDGNALESIYDQIAGDICSYGSISGCKYQDANNNGKIDTGEETLPGWEIVLDGDFSASQTTDADGCYTFAGLAAGNYTVMEGANADKEPYLQTYPESGSYDITLGEGENRGDVDFGNADSSLCQILEIGRQCVGDGQAEVTYAYNYEYCGDGWTNERVEDADCVCVETEIAGDCVDDTFREFTFSYNYDYCPAKDPETREDETCGNGGGEPGPECTDADGDGYGDNCELGPDCDDADPNINPGAEEICDEIDNNCDGKIDEGGVCEEEEPEDQPGDYDEKQDCEDAGYYWYDEICNLNPEPEPQCVDSDGDGYGVGDTTNCQYQGEDCNDANIDINPGAEEICDEIDNNCNNETDEGGVCGEPTPGPSQEGNNGGGGFVGGLMISGESVKSIKAGEVDMKITWTTTKFSTSQVIYDTKPGTFDPAAGAPNYGCAYSKEGDDSGLEKVTGHSVTLTGLNPGTTYYYHAVSAASPPVFSAEYSFVSPIAPEEEIENDIDSSAPQPSGTMEPAESGEVKGIDTEAPGTESNYLLEYIKINADNNPAEVKKLERFLNEFEGENLPVNGIYEQADFDAVSRFQKKYKEDILDPWNYDKATGYVYITTRKKINELYSQKELPLTVEQEEEIEKFRNSEIREETGNGKPEAENDIAGESESKEDEPVYLPEPAELEENEEEAGEVMGAEDDNEDTGNQISDVEEKEADEVKSSEEGEEKNATIMEALSRRWWVVLIIILAIAGGGWWIWRNREKEEDGN